MGRRGFAFIFFFFVALLLNAQVVINEASNKNYRQLIDEDGEYNDWIELYNTGTTPVTLTDWALSDSKNNRSKWEFDNTIIPSRGFLIIHASGKDRNILEEDIHWESAVLPTDTFSYVVPSASTPANWIQNDFNDTMWEKGQAGFGYNDNDDYTLLPNPTLSVYIRRKFTITDPTAISGAQLDVDYDDGFVAYLNGVKIASANMPENPLWDSFAAGNHEAAMYQNGIPEAFTIDIKTLQSILIQGDNILCIQAHNNSLTSSDLSIIPYLSFSLQAGKTFFQPAPQWLSTTPNKQLHANFKLASAGEDVFLTHNSIVVDSIKVPYMLLNQSVGRITDGAEQLAVFALATPGSSNNASLAYTQGYTLMPALSHTAGFYPSAITVSISSFEPNATLRYTLDGSEPTETSVKYSSPIKISASKSLKARTFAPEKLPGEVVTATYLINETYTLPVLSVTTNESNLYGPKGIFDNTNESWNVPSYVEYFEKDQQLAFSLLAGMQLDGGAGGSRTHPQHSFRIEPGNGTLGDGNLKYKLMPRRPNRDNFPSFYLRNGSNQYSTLPYKDALEVTALGQNTYTYYSAYHPVVVFLNGKYFGVYELREKINDDFLYDNYQMNIDSIDFLGMSYFYGTLHGGDRFSALRGSIEPFLTDIERFRKLNHLSASYLSEVDQFLDLKNYTDYIIAENWVANNDWPENNIKLFRCKGTNYRWQWALNDLEWGLLPNGWTTSNFDHFSFMINQGSGSRFTGFWYTMMLNSTYKANFINRYADLMNTNYHFSVTGPLENEFFNEMLPEIDAQYNRWRNINSKVFTTSHSTFRNELYARSSVVRGQIQSHYKLKNQISVTLDVEPREAGSIQISTIVPPNLPWTGIYFTDLNITVTALPNPGYTFSHWNTNTFIKEITNAVATGKFTGTQLTLKAFFETDNTSDAGIVISEINYKSGNNAETPDWIEFCNLSQQPVNLRGWYFTDKDTNHIFTFENDVMLAYNQRIIISNDYSKFKNTYPSAAHYPGEFGFGLGTLSDKIELFNNISEKVLAVHYSDNYPWALSNDNAGRTLELRQANSLPDNHMAWFRGCIGGSPGEAYQPCNEVVVSSPVALSAINSFNVKTYPVPAKELVTVNMYLTEETTRCTAQLFSVTGNLIRTWSFNNTHVGLNSFQLSLEGVKGNLLLLKITTNKNEKTVKILRIE